LHALAALGAIFMLRAATVITICKQFGVTSDWLLFPGMVQEYAAFRDEVSGIIIDLIEQMKKNPNLIHKLLSLDTERHPGRTELWAYCDELATGAYGRFFEWRISHRNDLIAFGPAMPFERPSDSQHR